MENRMTSSQKLNIELLYDPEILSSYMYKRTKSRDQNRHCTQMSTIALLTKAKKWKQSKCLSADDWVSKIV